MLTDIVNRQTVLELPVVDGIVKTDGVEDVLKVSVLDRFEGKGRKSVGYIKGYGLRQGAFATSFSFDEGNAVVIGSNDDDMAVAMNRIRELNGGLVYCRKGKVIVELPLPVFGTISELTGPEIASRIAGLISELSEMGCRKGNPLLTLLTLTFSAIPSLRLIHRFHRRGGKGSLSGPGPGPSSRYSTWFTCSFGGHRAFTGFLHCRYTMGSSGRTGSFLLRRRHGTCCGSGTTLYLTMDSVGKA